MIWVIIISAMLLASVASMLPLSRTVIFFLAVILLIFISGIRYKTGYDFDEYSRIYYSISIGENLPTVEFGWILFNTLILFIIKSSVGVYILSSFFIYGIIAFVLYKEFKYPAVGMLAFLLQIQFYWESLSIIRQYFAIALGILAVYQWMLNKKSIFFALSFVAASFHAPAIVVLGVPVVLKLKHRWLFVALSIIGGLLLRELFSEHLEAIFFLEKYRLYFDGTIVAKGEVSTGLVIYLRVFLALALIYQIDNFSFIDDSKKNLISNNLIIGYALFFIFYESTALRRISYYFIIYEVFAISCLVKVALQKNIAWQKYFATTTILIYLAFGAAILAKDVWINPVGRQQDSQENYEYRTIFE